MQILYADNHLLAVNKPAGLLTQPSGTDKQNLEDWAKEWVRKDKQKQGAVFLHAVHRLDAPVSGIVLFARTSKALSRLNALQREQRMEKRYLALVSPPPKQPQATLTHQLLHAHHHSKVMETESDDAKTAELSYRQLRCEESQALLEVTLKTGRYHQIRAQLAAIGSPIIGDERYGGIPWAHPGIALHHWKLSFPHPISQLIVEIEAQPPPYWERARVVF